MDDIQANLDAITLTRKNMLELTPEDHENENVRNLYQTMLQAQQTEETAPTETTNAEEDYLRAKYGSSYNDIQYQHYEHQGQKKLLEMRLSHNEKLLQLDDKLNTYASTITYVNNLEKVKKIMNDKIKSLVKKIQDSTANLNNRTTYYTEEYLLSLSRAILFENIFLISYVLIMLLDFKKVSHRELLIILTILFFSDLFLTLLHKLPNSIVYYTDWGYDPMESKTNWFLIVVLLVCLAGFFTFIQSINEFFTNLSVRI